MIIKTDRLNKVYVLGKVRVLALKEVSLSINKGIFLGVTGSSGSGKSTLLNLLGGLDTPTSGTIEVHGKLISEMNKEELALYRRYGVGMIFQSFNLIPVLNVYENIEFPLLLGNGKRGNKAEERDWIDHLIEEVGLSDWRTHKSNELSGGQRQRVAIARALVTKPEIVLADEPTANLDSKTGEDILNLMKKINREQNTTFIFSTHDATIVDMADHIIRLKDGQVIKNERISR